MMNPMVRSLISAAILIGAALFLYLYHVRTRSFDSTSRAQVTSWGFYGWIDWYLKLSTLVIALISIQGDPAWLLRVLDLPVLRLLGLLISGLALLLFAWGMKTLDAQYTPAHQSRLPERVVQSGPYRFIRHPIYTSNLILLSGMFLFSGSLWIVVNLVILIAYYVPTIIVEENAIRAHHSEYGAYANRTGRFVPRWHVAAMDEGDDLNTRRS